MTSKTRYITLRATIGACITIIASTASAQLVTAVTATSPLYSSGGTTPDISVGTGTLVVKSTTTTGAVAVFKVQDHSGGQIFAAQEDGAVVMSTVNSPSATPFGGIAVTSNVYLPQGRLGIGFAALLDFSSSSTGEFYSPQEPLALASPSTATTLSLTNYGPASFLAGYDYVGERFTMNATDLPSINPTHADFLGNALTFGYQDIDIYNGFETTETPALMLMPYGPLVWGPQTFDQPGGSLFGFSGTGFLSRGYNAAAMTLSVIGSTTPYQFGMAADRSGSTLDRWTLAYSNENSVTKSPVQVTVNRNSGATSVVINGDFSVTGTKSFAQQDPDDPKKMIMFYSLEGPESDTYARGTAHLSNGEAVISLPDDFRKVTSSNGLITAQVSALDECRGLRIASKSNNRLVVRELGGGKSNAAFDWWIQGVRAGHEHAPARMDKPDTTVRMAQKRPSRGAKGPRLKKLQPR